ncbi:MAG: Ig-like domain-containing protein, partial [Isosphaeraceae bacterium]
LVTALQNDMTQVTQAAIQTSTQPSYAVTNNYIYMYFASTTVGWSIPTPAAPQLARAQNQNPNGDPVTASRRPTFMGRYTPNIAVEVLDVSNGNIIARGIAQANGAFQARALTVLNPGVYTLTARGVTPGGETSVFSPWTTLTITSTPGRR